jgi:phosphatidylglycerophosphate synthase
VLDRFVRPLIDPPLDAAGARLARAGVTADTVTLVGFAVGLLAVPLLAAGLYGAALVAVVLNRLSDGLDGAVARHTRTTDLGGFLDIATDFIFYSAVPFGMALADPQANALWAALLIFAFVGTGSSFLAFATIAAKRGLETEVRGRKSFYHMGGLAEGSETIAALVLICLVPGWFTWIAGIFAAACWITTLGRFLEARAAFAGSD